MCTDGLKETGLIKNNFQYCAVETVEKRTDNSRMNNTGAHERI